MQAYLPPGLFSRHLQPLIRFRASFSRARLEATGSITDFSLRDRAEEDFVGYGGETDKAQSNPFAPKLHGMLEAQLSRMHAAVQCRLRHQQSDQVVSQQIDPQLFLAHRWAFAAQHFQSQRCLDVAKVELYVPAPLIELAEFSLRTYP